RDTPIRDFRTYPSGSHAATRGLWLAGSAELRMSSDNTPMITTLGEVLPHSSYLVWRPYRPRDSGREFSFRDLDGLSGALARNLVKRRVTGGLRDTLYAQFAGVGRQLLGCA